jgi:hypothetical protein
MKKLKNGYMEESEVNWLLLPTELWENILFHCIPEWDVRRQAVCHAWQLTPSKQDALLERFVEESDAINVDAPEYLREPFDREKLYCRIHAFGFESWPADELCDYVIAHDSVYVGCYRAYQLMVRAYRFCNAKIPPICVQLLFQTLTCVGAIDALGWRQLHAALSANCHPIPHNLIMVTESYIHRVLYQGKTDYQLRPYDTFASAVRTMEGDLTSIEALISEMAFAGDLLHDYIMTPFDLRCTDAVRIEIVESEIVKVIPFQTSFILSACSLPQLQLFMQLTGVTERCIRPLFYKLIDHLMRQTPNPYTSEWRKFDGEL